MGEKNLAVLERIRDERKTRINQSSLLYIYFKAWNPNRTLRRMEPYLRWMFTPGFVIFSIAIFVIAMSILAGDWARVQKDTGGTLFFLRQERLRHMGLLDHHAVPRRHPRIRARAHMQAFRRRSESNGVSADLFHACFYTDTTDILLFESTAPREYVIFAGIWVELVICSLATFVWALSVPGSTMNDLAYKLLLLSGISGAY